MDIYETYKLNSFNVFVGWTKNKNNSTIKPKILFQDKSGMTLFSDTNSSDCFIINPTFFKSKIKTDPIFILAESGSEYSWGNDIYSFKNNRITYIGFLDIATYDEHSNPENIAPLTDIKINGKTIVFSFNAKKVVFGQDSKNEKIYSGSDISYVYSDNILKLKTHSR